MQVHTADDDVAMEEAAKFVTAQLSGRETEERRFGCMKFLVPYGSSSPAQIFRSIEMAKDQFGIVAYGVSLPTLEQVFLSVIGEALHH